MINGEAARRKVATAFAEAVDELVRDRMDGLVEEPDITSRLGQRLEDRFDGQILAGHRVRVISETVTSHGRGSLEKPLGADLYVALSVEDACGLTTTKGVLIQAKRRDRLDPAGLSKQCRRMMHVTRKGSVAWIYTRTGVDVVRATDTTKKEWPVLSASQFFDAVLKCTLGDLRRVPNGSFGNRRALKAMLEKMGADNAIWLELQEQ
ncbi:hypothetical protein [Sphingosinicella sp. BN140058]|uniref:hypothetical protein n=1 Tax=Sphingosinicella sp. BN140058 TaxID=1892855 RepID=UPI00101009DA|nr:hypothetical protein [Sphingosinicella sp. BN140058]QAY77253.1 hypothetical protein ETR14_12635 [Sphingosinicella sp. BN140058]